MTRGNGRFDAVLRDFRRNPAASAAAIRELADAMRMQMPDDYTAFLLETNGGQGMIGKAYVILWKVEELVRMNAAYRIPDCAPGLFAIGSDGGGEAFAFDTRTKPWPVVMVPFIGLDLQDAEIVGASFASFLTSLAGA